MRGRGQGSKEPRLGQGHRPARRREAGPPIVSGVREGSQRSGPRFQSWHPPRGSWETPFCSEGPGLSCFPPAPQLLRVQPSAAAPRVDRSPSRAR